MTALHEFFRPLWKRHCVMFSGGAGSWAAAKRVIAEHGPKRVILLFADTLIEDADLYRFLKDAEDNLGVKVTRIADGRTPWQVFEHERFIGNSRVDPCSRILKRELLDRWRNKNLDPTNSVIYVGLGGYEPDRVERLLKRMAETKWTYRAPMAEGELLDPEEVLQWMEREGIKRPALYEEGFSHNNCGGFCVKAGQAHFARLLKKRRAYYLFNESEEQRLRAQGINGAILTDRRNKKRVPMTLKQFRIRLEGDENAFDASDVGGCGCALDTGPGSL